MTTTTKVVNEFKEWLMQEILDDMGDKYTYIGMGTGTTTAADTDTDLESEVDINASATLTRQPTDTPIKDTTAGKITYQCWISQTEGNGNTLSECGIADSDDGGTDNFLFRSTFTGISKTSSKEIKVIIEVTVTITLNS